MKKKCNYYKKHDFDFFNRLLVYMYLEIKKGDNFRYRLQNKAESLFNYNFLCCFIRA